MSKKYRICYEALFFPKQIEGFKYKGKGIYALSLHFLCLYSDRKTGEEIFFKEEEQPVREFFDCYIDKGEGFRMKCLHCTDYHVLYDLYECFVFFLPSGESDLVTKEKISREEARHILRDNFQKWDDSDNKPTQCTAYCSVPVEERKGMSNI